MAVSRHASFDRQAILKVAELQRSHLVIGSLMWKPFDTRFQHTIDRLTFYQQLLKDEISLANLQETYKNSAVISAECLKADCERRHAADDRSRTTQTIDKLNSLSDSSDETVRLLEQQMRSKRQ
jgi:hypothetical protein